MRGASGCKQLRMVPYPARQVVSPPSRSLQTHDIAKLNLVNLWFSTKMTIFRFWCALCGKRKNEAGHNAPDKSYTGPLRVTYIRWVPCDFLLDSMPLCQRAYRGHFSVSFLMVQKLI